MRSYTGFGLGRERKDTRRIRQRAERISVRAGASSANHLVIFAGLWCDRPFVIGVVDSSPHHQASFGMSFQAGCASRWGPSAGGRAPKG